MLRVSRYKATAKLCQRDHSDNGINSAIALVRYNGDGTLDSGFGVNGRVVTSVGSDGDNGNAVAIQSDGRIVVAGSSFGGGRESLLLLRYNSDGSLDPSFSAD